MSEIAAPPPSVRATESAISTVTGRTLIQVSTSDALALSETLSGPDSGLVVTGPKAQGLASRIRRHRPSMPVGVDLLPEKSWTANPEEPFLLGEATLFSEPSLEAALDDQRQVDASFVLTPTGHIEAGDSESLKAVVHQANREQCTDMIVRLPCDAAWVTRQYIRQLSAIISTSHHPIALSLAAEQDPLERAGVAENVWNLASTHPHLMLYRTDLAALAHLANGGLAASFGFTTTLRHGVRPGPSGRAINVTDRTPGVLLPDFLAFLRGSRIEDIYAATAAPRCHCAVCKGRALDRFDETTPAKFQAQAHNVAVLRQLYGYMTKVPSQARAAWWQRTVTQAVQAHEDATNTTRVTVLPSSALKSWATLPIPAV